MAGSGRTIVTAAVVAAVVGLGFGCLATTAASADGLTRREWLERANALCDHAQQQVYALESSVLHGEVFPSSFPSQSFSDYLTRTAQIGRRLVHDLRALKAPPRDRELINAGLAAMTDTVDSTAHLAELARGDGTGYQDAVRRRVPTKEEKKLGADRFKFQNYGAGSCAFIGLGPGAGE